jgi:cyclopropane fatty-acyl-phospholipid synthase-like methyltransferase
LIYTQQHTRHSDAQAVAYPYDVSNAFCAQWLDPAMLYSCTYFEPGNETLAQAQVKKIDHILSKLRLAPGQRLLDLGCGWGAGDAHGARARFDQHRRKNGLTRRSVIPAAPRPVIPC